MINWFRRTIGEDNVSEEGASKLVYGSDASQIEGNPTFIVRPGDAKELHQIILFIRRNHANLVLRGGGTGLVGGAVPENSIVLDLSRMNRILDFGADSVIVEPGIILDELNKKLGDKFFPVVPASSKSCTIGGMIATNAVGTRAVKYGRTSDWVNWVEIIDGDGRLRKAELKDIAGKEGITGVIVSAELKIINKPKKKKVEMMAFEYLPELLFKIQGLKEVSAVEFINKTAASLAGLGDKYYLIIEKEEDGDGGEEIWNIRDNLYPKLASSGYPIIEDPKIELNKMEPFLNWLDENKIPAFGHIMVGIIHPCFQNNEKIDEMYDLVIDLNGEISGEHGIGIKKRKYTDRMFKERMRLLKGRYDKEGIFNRGKLI